MKLRQLPEDFKVEELCELKVKSTKGDYKVFSVEKSGIETFYMLGYLAKQNRIPLSEISVAGLKDKHALTRQFLTIPSRYDLRPLKEKNLSVKFLGFSDTKLKLGDLRGNRFEVTVRDIKKGELDGIYEKAKTLPLFGVPNYFDSQRFGSALGGEFIMKRVLKKDYEKAVKIFLTGYSKSENRRSKDEKRRLLAAWPDLAGVRVQNSVTRNIIDEYLGKKDWLAAYRKIPQNLREMFVSAYQSWLWNECIKELLRKASNMRYLYSVEYNLGSLLFYKRLTNEEMRRIPKTFQTISDELVPSDAERKIIEKVLAKEGVSIDEFKIKEVVGNFFKTRERQVILRPKDFHLSLPMIDELNDKGKGNRFKIVVKFELPKASYATIIIKRLFNQ
jgi:tRNA pseudouridine13 synthase